jgi:hypothetical protein
MSNIKPPKFEDKKKLKMQNQHRPFNLIIIKDITNDVMLNICSKLNERLSETTRATFYPDDRTGGGIQFMFSDLIKEEFKLSYIDKQQKAYKSMRFEFDFGNRGSYNTLISDPSFNSSDRYDGNYIIAKPVCNHHDLGKRCTERLCKPVSVMLKACDSSPWTKYELDIFEDILLQNGFKVFKRTDWYRKNMTVN